MELARKFDASPGGAVITQPFPLGEAATMAGSQVCGSEGRLAICSLSAAQSLDADPSGIFLLRLHRLQEA
jgi:hypothetical protein